MLLPMNSMCGETYRAKVDVVVVYKVDRLTRSLTDFAKIVEKAQREEPEGEEVSEEEGEVDEDEFDDDSFWAHG